METETRDFKGVWIPREIYLHPELTWTEKLLYCEIDSLDGEGGCFASNEYFAKFLGVGIWTISNGIKKLKDLGFVSQESFDGRRRVLKAEFRKITKQGCEKSQGRVEKNHIHNNIDYNNSLDKGNNKTINSFITKEDDSTDVGKDRVRKNTNTVKEFIPPTLEECKAYAKEIHCWKELGIDFYNYYSLGGWTDKTGKKIKAWKQKMYQWYMHDKEKYYNDIPEPHIPTEEEIQNFKRAEPLRKV